jgi:ABC-2 type transport system permease protein
MRLWAEERRIGTIELVTTLPISIRDLVVGKWLAAWAFACVALALTVPIWFTVEYLGEPDRGAIIAGYVGSALMAGAFLAIGSALSAVTKNQVVAFVLCAVVCFLLLMAGYPVVLDFLGGWASPAVAEAVASVSLLTHFEPMERGVIDLRDVLFFAAVVAAFLWLNILLIEWKKAD